MRKRLKIKVFSFASCIWPIRRKYLHRQIIQKGAVNNSGDINPRNNSSGLLSHKGSPACLHRLLQFSILRTIKSVKCRPPKRAISGCCCLNRSTYIPMHENIITYVCFLVITFLTCKGKQNAVHAFGHVLQRMRNGPDGYFTHI